MAEILKDVEHLANEIGPRPAGTEEERVAAMYIAENIQKRSGLTFGIEDFEGAKGRTRAVQLCAIVGVLLFFIAVLLPIISWPAFLVCAIAAVIAVLEFLEKPILSNFLRFGVSQNVVAKYEPGYSNEKQHVQRKRKVIIISHYDSGHSYGSNSEGSMNIYAVAGILSVIAICLIPIILLIKAIAFSSASGSTLLLFIIFAIILAIFALAPILLDFLEARKPYSDGANCNGSGSAALIEIARQLGTGSYDLSDVPAGPRPVVHGMDAAVRSNLIPEGAEIEYTEPDIKDPLAAREASLANAKAAIEAFTAPRAPRKQYDDDGNEIKPVLENKEIEEKVEVEIEQKTDENVVPKYKSQEKHGETPSWFKTAQSKAKKSDEEDIPVEGQRSRFAHTMDYMAKKEEDEKKKKEEEEERERAKIRARIVEAQRQAEEERKREFAEEKPFVKEGSKDKMSLDERFKRHQEEKEKNQFPKIAEPVQPKEEVVEEKKVEEEVKEVESTQAMPQVDVDKIQESKQYAPLDDAEFVSSNELPKNSSMIDLPEVFTDNPEQSDPAYAEALKETDKEVEHGKFGTGSFAAVSEPEGVAGATGTFAPVSEELINDASKSGEIDIVVDDADDSVYKEGEFTDTGAFAGAGYVEMPEEKPKKIFGIFGRKKDSGKHSQDDGFVEAKPYSEGDISIDDNWEGGAYVQNEPHVESIVEPVPEFEQQIQEFHNQAINIDVWMVALGSEIKENAGIKAFLYEHAKELKGAVIIDIEGIGAGQLSLVDTEGYITKSKTSPRTKRYVRQAANKLNIKIPTISIPWSSSSAAYANKLGFKAIRLVGSDGKKPAYYLQDNDVIENINEETLNNNIDYIMQLIQCI
ncbi:MAG: hypothetical protein Q4E88_04445 [Coriobacteriia bacterium]|nr:hypothetical protein [Coriobacteriia bacterium]